jgi:hypothetical protein
MLIQTKWLIPILFWLFAFYIPSAFAENIRVYNCGLSVANGAYIQDGTNEGSPFWTGSDGFYIYRASNYWFISNNFGNNNAGYTQYYASMYADQTPLGSTFTTANGGTPAGSSPMCEVMVLSDINGCMDSLAYNFDLNATVDDGSCITATSTVLLVNQYLSGNASSTVVTFYDYLLINSWIMFCLSFIPAYFFLNCFYNKNGL